MYLYVHVYTAEDLLFLSRADLLFFWAHCHALLVKQNYIFKLQNVCMPCSSFIYVLCMFMHITMDEKIVKQMAFSLPSPSNTNISNVLLIYMIWMAKQFVPIILKNFQEIEVKERNIFPLQPEIVKGYVLCYVVMSRKR